MLETVDVSCYVFAHSTCTPGWSIGLKVKADTPEVALRQTQVRTRLQAHSQNRLRVHLAILKSSQGSRTKVDE